jgi:hypothetical protein
MNIRNNNIMIFLKLARENLSGCVNHQQLLHGMEYYNINKRLMQILIRYLQKLE